MRKNGVVVQEYARCDLDGLDCPPVTITNYKVIGTVTAVNTQVFTAPQSPGGSQLINQSYSQTIANPVYWVGKTVTNCAGDIAEALAYVQSAAQFIIANAKTYSLKLVSPAEQAEAAWQETGLILDTAVEFLAGIAAFMTIAGWLKLALSIGLGALLAFALWHCAFEGK